MRANRLAPREVGTIETGKLADILVLSANHPETWTAPQADPHDRIAFAATRSTVRHVLVAGRPLVEDGRLLYLDLEEIYRESTRSLGELIRIRRSGVEL